MSIPAAPRTTCSPTWPSSIQTAAGCPSTSSASCAGRSGALRRHVAAAHPGTRAGAAAHVPVARADPGRRAGHHGHPGPVAAPARHAGCRDDRRAARGPRPAHRLHAGTSSGSLRPGARRALQLRRCAAAQAHARHRSTRRWSAVSTSSPRTLPASASASSPTGSSGSRSPCARCCGTDTATRTPRPGPRLLQARTRRFYRIRELHQLRCQAFGPHLTCLARLRRGRAGRAPVTRVRVPGGPARLRRRAAGISRHVCRRTSGSSWISSPGGPANGGTPTPMAAELADLLARTDFGRMLHRLDITVTSASGPDPERTGRGASAHPALHLPSRRCRFQRGSAVPQHAPDDRRTPRPVAAVELQAAAVAKRRGCLPVPRGRPREPQGRAPDRDRRGSRPHPARDSAGRIIGFPHLEGMLAQALADIRHALGRQPPRQRPLSNRVILYVRPTWDIPTGTWRRRGAPAGADAPQALAWRRSRSGSACWTPATGESRDAVLDVENVADRAVTVRVRPPADRPIRPLTEYKQKLLRSQRLGVPYPYELIRMLTPPRGCARRLPGGRVHRV